MAVGPGTPIPNTQKYGGKAVSTGQWPEEGTKAFPVVLLNLTANVPVTIDLVEETQLGEISSIQGVFIDNAANAGAFSLTCDGMEQTITCGGNKQMYVPLLCEANRFNAVSVPGGTVTLLFTNFPMQSFQWLST